MLTILQAWGFGLARSHVWGADISGRAICTILNEPIRRKEFLAVLSRSKNNSVSRLDQFIKIESGFDQLIKNSLKICRRITVTIS